MKALGFFDPYTYQPKVAGYFMGRPFPSELSTVAQTNPGKATHIVSLWQFGVWLNQTSPDLYNKIKSQNPALLDPSSVILQGKLNAPVFYANPPTPPKPSGGTPGKTAVAGLGALAADASSDSGVTTTSDVVTEWGKNISDILGKYLVYDQQKKLIDLNIKRAEQGLAPISSQDLAAGVNIGLADSTQRLAYVALGALVLVGVATALRRGR